MALFHIDTPQVIGRVSKWHSQAGGRRWILVPDAIEVKGLTVLSTMMDRPLLVTNLLWRAEHVFGQRVNISCWQGAAAREFTYAELASTVRRLAAVLKELGVTVGTRVGSVAWNTDRHLAAYYAVPALGAILHTVNQRMPADHIAYTINTAGDELLLVDSDLLPVIESIADRIQTVKHLIVLGSSNDVPAIGTVWSFDELIAGASELQCLPDIDERSAASICFTSGTTGMPKGVVYSHRSTVLHALALCATGSAGVSGDRSYLLATQMSHVHSWGVPYAGALQGARLILPGPHPTAADFLKIVTTQAPDVFVGSPTVAAMMRDEYMRAPHDYDLGSLRRLWLGGQAPTDALAQWWAGQGAETTNGWGMTEASPTGTFCQGYSSQGLPLPLFEIRIVDPEGRELEWDGQSTGELEVRSPWVTGSYLDGDGHSASFHDGWFRTGDVACIDGDGQLHIRDRIKDLIKSGGEWISSIEVENHLTLHPKIVEAAVIAVPDDRWQERPVAWIVVDGDVGDDELQAHIAAELPRFWIPDSFVRVSAIPKTSVGKIDKVAMRACHGDDVPSSG